MSDYPQVVLFGSIHGDWREKYVIPLLDSLAVSYYNPVSDTAWTTENGDREAEVMAHCETIVMVFNDTSPSFTGLAEAGWAALGAAQRKQNFILHADLNYNYWLSDNIRQLAEGQDLQATLNHWATSIRYLVHKHAKEFNIDTMHVMDDMAGVQAKLNELYGK